MNQNKRLLPTDIVLAAYLLAVGALQLVFYRHGYTNITRATAYITGGGLVLVLARRLPMWQHPLALFLRTSYPLMATAGLFVQLNQLFFTVVPHYVDSFFIRMEEALFGLQPAHVLPAMFPSRWFTEAMAVFYMSYYLVIPTLAFLLFFGKRHLYYRAVWGLTFGFYICYLIYVMLPVAGPTIPLGISLTDQFHGYVLAEALKGILLRGEVNAACFPSSHVAITFLAALYAARYTPRWAWFFFIISLGVSVATVWLKQHYAVDVISGYVVGTVFFLAAERMADHFINPFAETPVAAAPTTE